MSDEFHRKYHAGKYESSDTLPMEDIDPESKVRNQAKLEADHSVAGDLAREATKDAIEADKKGDKEGRRQAAAIAESAYKVRKDIRERSKKRKESQRALDRVDF